MDVGLAVELLVVVVILVVVGITVVVIAVDSPADPPPYATLGPI